MNTDADTKVVVDDMDFPEEPQQHPYGNPDEGEPAEESSQIETHVEQPAQEPAHPESGPVVEGDSIEPAPEEVDVAAQLRAQLDEAMGKLAQYERAALAGKMDAPQQEAQRPSTAPQQPAFQLPKSPSEVTNVDFLGDADHLQILESRDQFNALLNRIVTVAMNASTMMSQETILRQIPDIVQRSAQQQHNISKITENFYAANPDLASYKQAVSMAAMQAYNDNPGLSLEELLAEAGSRTRKALQLTVTRQRVPAQPVGRGGGVDRTAQAPQLSSTEQQILDMLNLN